MAEYVVVVVVVLVVVATVVWAFFQGGYHTASGPGIGNQSGRCPNNGYPPQ